MAGLLELARLMSKLFAAPRSQPKFNVAFVLSAAGMHNFAGARHWLATADPRLVDTVVPPCCSAEFIYINDDDKLTRDAL